MNKNLILLLVIVGIYYSCSKNVQNGPKNSATQIKIELVSGGGQTDTVGKPLNSPIVVKVTVGGVAKSGYTVQFQGAGCDEDNIISTPSGPDGTTQYIWSVEGTGQQTMKAFVLNSNNQKADSISVNATGLPPGAGWHNSACSLEGSSSATNFCKLSSGRLFTCFAGEQTYLRYSDDNGASWNAVKSLGNTHTITWVVSTPADEVLAFTEGNDGTFYSADGGQTWTNQGVPPFNTLIFSSIISTPSGRLVAVGTAAPPFSVSADKGKTWTTAPFSAFVPQNPNNPSFHDPAEDKDGNLYVIEIQDQNLFKSTDGGKTWSLVPHIPTSLPGTDNAFYIADNNWFYRSSEGTAVYVSKDGGVTYTQFLPYSVGGMSVQSDGNFYFIVQGNLFRYNVTNGSQPEQIFGNSLNSKLSTYVVAKNGNIVVNNQGNEYIKYYTN